MKFAATAIGAGVIAAASLATHAGTPIAWNNTLGGEWRTAANWDPMVVPGLSDDVLLALTDPYTVNVLGADAAAANLTISNNNATLAVTSARLLDIGQSIQNTGVITVNPTAQSTTQLRLASGVLLSGPGQILLNAPGSRSWISPATPDAAFTQAAGHTIAGQGQITTGMTNNGLVLADVPGGELILSTNPKVNNALFSATNGGSLVLQGSTVDQSSQGAITADGAGSTVLLRGVTVNGGTIEASDGGLISVINSDASINSLAITGESEVSATRTLNASGTITHNGHMTVNPTTSFSTTSIRVDNSTVLTGQGVITLNSSASRAQIIPAAAGDAFTQAAGHTIEGHGQITAGMTNNGLISANDDGLELVLNTNPKANNARMQAIDGGTLTLTGQTTTQSPTATITADGAGSTVRLAGGTINGGTIEAVNGGLISVNGGNPSINTLTLAGDSEVTSARTLNASGTITHNGRMIVNPTTSISTTSIRVADGTVLTGSGVITLNAPSARAQITATPAEPDGIFIQAAGHTIEGQGQIPAGMINNGLVSANVGGGLLDLSRGNKTNNAQIRAVDGGTLRLSLGVTMDQAPDATITADGPGSTIEIGNATISGGTIQAVNNGLISVTVNGNPTINSLTLAGDSQITSARIVDATGTITHNGHMVINPTASLSTATLRFADATVLNGDGVITLNAPGFRAQIGPAAPNAVLTVGPGQTIAGIGQIGIILNLEGTLAPGLGVGTMTASQAITLSDTAVFEAEVSGPTTADQLDASRSFHADGTLNVTFVDGFDPPLSWTAVIVDASQGVTGAFDTVNAPQPTNPRLEFRVVYSANTIRIGAFCTADANADGLLNFFDISQFIADYNAGRPAADIAAPFGILNFFDIAAFIARYNTGCP